MRHIILGMILFVGVGAQARPNYYNTYVPQALANLGINGAGWAGTCMNCHGTATAFGDYNATFGAAFVAEAGNLGFVLTANGVDDLTQAQVQQIIQNILPQDSDGDGFTNEAEFTARTDVADPLNNPNTGTSGGGGSNPCTTDPTLPQCQNSGSSGGGSGQVTGTTPVSGDAAYQLNPGCAASEETVMRETREIKTASAAPLVGVMGLWILPFLVGVLRRRK